MSHYAVAVFSDDEEFERLLAPYNVGNTDYFKFIPVPYEKIVEKFELFHKNNPAWSIEMYLNEFKYVQQDDQWGYMENPNGHFNYYSLDGKGYMFDLRKGAKLEEDRFFFRKSDYLWFKTDKEAQEDAREFWDDFVGPTAIAEPPGPWNKKYFLNRYKTREQYVKECGRTIPYAFITPDGVWHSAGNMLWFGMSDETAENADNYAEEWFAWINSDTDPFVSIVDCHI